MANDRLLIACRLCHQGRPIFKYYPSGGYATTGDSINAFIEKHFSECWRDKGDGRGHGMTLDGCHPFYLVTENETGEGVWRDSVLFIGEKWKDPIEIPTD